MFVDHTIVREIFTIKIIHEKKFVVLLRFVPYAKFFLMVDSYNMNENQVSLAVMLWLSGVVLNRAFTSGGVDVRTETYLLIITAYCLHIFYNAIIFLFVTCTSVGVHQIQ